MQGVAADNQHTTSISKRGGRSLVAGESRVLAFPQVSSVPLQRAEASHSFRILLVLPSHTDSALATAYMLCLATRTDDSAPNPCSIHLARTMTITDMEKIKSKQHKQRQRLRRRETLTTYCHDTIYLLITTRT